jgi:hypothetical protein
MRSLPFFTLLLAPVAILAGCQAGAESPGEPDDLPAPMSVVPSSITIDGGNALTLTAKIRSADGAYATPDDIAWCSSNGDVASVDAGGHVLGLKPGKAQIVATWHGSRGSSVITVIESDARKIEPPPLAFAKKRNVAPASGCAAASGPGRQGPPQ